MVKRPIKDVVLYAVDENYGRQPPSIDSIAAVECDKVYRVQGETKRAFEHQRLIHRDSVATTPEGAVALYCDKLVKANLELAKQMQANGTKIDAAQKLLRNRDG